MKADSFVVDSHKYMIFAYDHRHVLHLLFDAQKQQGTNLKHTWRVVNVI